MSVAPKLLHSAYCLAASFKTRAQRHSYVSHDWFLALQLAGPSESVSRLGLRSKFSKEEAAGAATAGEAAVASAKAYGQVILTAGYDGVIKVFENLSPPHWL